MRFTKDFILWEQSQMTDLNGKLISSNKLELVNVIVDGKEINHQSGNTSRFKVPMKESRSNDLSVIWKIKNNSKAPILINKVYGSDLSYRKIKVMDWDKTPVSPGDTVNVKINIQTVNGADLNVLCRENFSSYNDASIFISVGGSVEHTLKFRVKLFAAFLTRT